MVVGVMRTEKVTHLSDMMRRGVGGEHVGQRGYYPTSTTL